MEHCVGRAGCKDAFHLWAYLWLMDHFMWRFHSISCFCLISGQQWTCETHESLGIILKRSTSFILSHFYIFFTVAHLIQVKLVVKMLIKGFYLPDRK